MNPVAVIGVGQTHHVSRRQDVNAPELVSEAVGEALTMAGIEPQDVEAVVFGAAIASIQEGFEHVGKWVNDSIGGYLKPCFRVQTGGTVGASAVIGAIYMVASGLFDIVLAAAGTPRAGASGAAAQRALALASDPIYRRGFSGGAVLGLALTFRQYMDRSGVTEEQAAQCVVQQRSNAGRNPFAHLREPVTIKDVLGSRPLAPPVKLLDMCPTSVGAGAVIITSGETVKKRKIPAAWIHGFASITEPATYPGRDPLEARAVREAAQHSYRMAGITDPRQDLDVVELYNACSYQQMHWSEALGLCKEGEGGRFLDSGATDFSGDLPINPSGGVLCTNNGSDAALLRVAEAALQVMGRAGEHQVPDARRSLAMGWGGNQQFASCIVLGQDRP